MQTVHFSTTVCNSDFFPLLPSNRGGKFVHRRFLVKSTVCIIYVKYHYFGLKIWHICFKIVVFYHILCRQQTADSTVSILLYYLYTNHPSRVRGVYIIYNVREFLVSAVCSLIFGQACSIIRRIRLAYGKRNFPYPIYGRFYSPLFGQLSCSISGQIGNGITIFSIFFRSNRQMNATERNARHDPNFFL